MRKIAGIEDCNFAWWSIDAILRGETDGTNTICRDPEAEPEDELSDVPPIRPLEEALEIFSYGYSNAPDLYACDIRHLQCLIFARDQGLEACELDIVVDDSEPDEHCFYAIGPSDDARMVEFRLLFSDSWAAL